MDVVARVRAASERGDIDEVGRLIVERPIEIWFGVPPAEIHALVSSLGQNVIPRDSVAGFLLAMASGQSVEGLVGSDPAWSAAFAANDELRKTYVFLQAMQARVAGDAARAYEILRPLVDTPIRPRVYRDVSGGLDGLVLLQTAMSAALAGRADAALALYDRVLLSAPDEPGLAFYVRESYMRSALLLALFGDLAEARSRFAQAAEVPRTESWVESLLDVEQVLVEALLSPPRENRAAVDRVLGVPLQHLGEMWPFYVSVLHRLTVATELRERGRARIQALEATGIAPPAGTGSGLPGSVFAIAYAWDHLMTGNTVAAREELDKADPALVASTLLSAFHAISTGAITRALQLARSARDDARGWSQLEAMRLMLVATAHFVAREPEESEAALRQLAPLLTPYGMSLLQGLSKELCAFAVERIDEWPSFVDVGVTPSVVGVLDAELLSPRELDVLRGLAHGKNREEIAAGLFLSVNTVKTHQQSLYRKLGVSSIGAAVIEGARRRLV